MAEIVNLRMARKAKQRADAQGKAAANRAKHGQTRAERELQRLEAGRADRLIDGARREQDD